MPLAGQPAPGAVGVLGSLPLRQAVRIPGGGVIEAVVFDMDGVLIDSEPVWERVRREFVASRGGRWAPDAQDKMMGMSTAEWSAYLSEDFGLRVPAPQVAELVIAAMA